MAETEGKSVKQLATDLSKSVTAIRYQIGRQKIEIKDGLVYGDGLEKLERFYKEKDAGTSDRKAYETKKKPKPKARESKLPYEIPKTEGMLIGRVYPSPALRDLLASYDAKFGEYKQRIEKLETRIESMPTIAGRTFEIAGLVKLRETPDKKPVKHRKHKTKKK